MSTVQVIASERFINAMGPMIMSEEKMTRVLRFISTMRSEEPCRYSDAEVRALGIQAIDHAKQGLGISHTEAKQIAAQWVK